MKILPSLILSFILVGFWSCSDSGINPPDVVVDDCGITDGDNSSCVNFSTQIKPIFSTNNLCTLCHGNSGNLSLNSYEDLMMRPDVIDPGNSSGSLLIQKLRGTSPPNRMPKGGDPLDETTINLIETWIDEGALNN